MHDTSNSMYLIIKEIICCCAEFREDEEYLRNYLKGSTAISAIWCEDPQMTNRAEEYNPKYLVESADETACCKPLLPRVWAVWMYMHMCVLCLIV